MREDMKTFIADTFARMLEKEDLDKITVTRLIEECQISRQTFYYHYRDIMDVLEWAFSQSARKLAEEGIAAQTRLEAISSYISFIKNNRIKLGKLRSSKRWVQIEGIFIDTVTDYLGQMVRSKASDVRISLDDMQILLRFYACGMIGVLLQYAGQKEIDEKKLAKQMERILIGDLSLVQS